MPFGLSSSDLKRLAEEKARKIADELSLVTGNEYEVRSYTLGSHYVFVRELNTNNDVLGYVGNRWEDVFVSTRDALNTLYEYRNAIETKAIERKA